MKGNIVLMVGLSGSGKSTHAKKMREKLSSNTVILSRDKVREMCFGYTESTVSDYYKRDDFIKCEKQVTLLLDEMIRFNINAGRMVIIDNTHLKLKYIKEYAKFTDRVTLAIVDTDLDECIYRDSKRDRIVGFDVILSQNESFNQLKKDLSIDNFGEEVNLMIYSFDEMRISDKNSARKKDCIIVDIDGTLAEKGTRNPFDWGNVWRDSYKENVCSIVKVLSQTYDIVICTGRDSVCWKDTVKWSGRGGIESNNIYAREHNDNRPDYIVKEEMWREIMKSYNIVAMIDDRRQVIDHARRLGFTVLDVANNTF